MNEKIGVSVKLKDNTIRNYTLEVRQAPLWQLTFSGTDDGRREFEGSDLFEAMIELRKVLEQSGKLLLCAGARLEVFPSAMSRSMSGGRKAYTTRLGEPAERSDIVDIFEYAKPESVVSVEQQFAFHKKWAASLEGRQVERL